MSRSVIAPIVAVLCMIAQIIFHVQIPDDVQAQIVTETINVVALGWMVYGLFKKQKQSNTPEEEQKNDCELWIYPFSSRPSRLHIWSKG